MLEKAYDPKGTEDRIYKMWPKSFMSCQYVLIFFFFSILLSACSPLQSPQEPNIVSYQPQFVNGSVTVKGQVQCPGMQTCNPPYVLYVRGGRSHLILTGSIIDFSKYDGAYVKVSGVLSNAEEQEQMSPMIDVHSLVEIKESDL